jgi:2-polyprenyl-6-methoxyphenol hydroxylase-like FAD-dependent oxidoreductase
MVNQRQGNGSYRNYFGLTVPEDFFRTTVNLHDLEATRQLLLSDFYADWSEYYKDTIRHATDLRPWQLYSLSTEDMNWTSVPGVALIGDAAHVTLPNGEGVNQAMADALKLASLIAEHGAEKLDQAVQEYEADMFPRAIATIAEGKGMADIMFAEGPEPFVQLMNSFAGERP